MASFVQIDLENWEPGPYSLIAVVSLLPEEIQERCGVKFDEILEDLGLMDIAFIELPDGARYILMKYRDSPSSKTQLLGLEKVPTQMQNLKPLLECLGLDGSFLVLISSEHLRP